MADKLALTVPVASQYLRALNARGLLTAERDGRYVRYRVQPAGDTRQSRPLLGAIHQMLKQRPDAIEHIVHLCTAFTYPRRLALARLIGQQGVDLRRLRASAGMSRPALDRHLAKLQSRGFITIQHGRCRRSCRPDRLARVLSALAHDASS